jgi:hypothetical protein
MNDRLPPRQRLVPASLPDDAPRTRHQAVPEFETTAQGSRVATSVGGVLTGRGADIIVIDDPLKPEEALSQTQRQAANEWYDHTLYSRLNDKLTGAIVLIMHRPHEDDLAGHVLEQEPWEVVRLPAIADDAEWHRVARADPPDDRRVQISPANTSRCRHPGAAA